MKYHMARYYLEHKLIPFWFYRKKFSFLGTIIQDKGFFYRRFCDILKEEGFEAPFAEDEFSVALYPISERSVIVALWMPKPRWMHDCWAIYLCFDVDFERPALFTLEYSIGCSFLCAWTASGMHLNFGDSTLEDAFGRILKIYKWK